MDYSKVTTQLRTIQNAFLADLNELAEEVKAQDIGQEPKDKKADHE